MPAAQLGFLAVAYGLVYAVLARGTISRIMDVAVADMDSQGHALVVACRDLSDALFLA